MKGKKFQPEIEYDYGYPEKKTPFFFFFFPEKLNEILTSHGIIHNLNTNSQV